MKRVGIVGYRGMVGSVPMERMRAENDFAAIEPVFFSTSQAGGKGPDIGKALELDEILFFEPVEISRVLDETGIEQGQHVFLTHALYI
jgi:aspartate-semialdehyde dehydrogenase